MKTYPTRQEYMAEMFRNVKRLDGGRGCWLWRGNLYGYHLMSYRGRVEGVHRVAWMLWRGRIPGNTAGARAKKRRTLNICHRCDTPPCVNPKHLFLGSHSDNTRDAIMKGRIGSRGECTEAHADLARHMFRHGLSLIEVSDYLGFTVDTLTRALRRDTHAWKK